jgi:hypothetical protein
MEFQEALPISGIVCSVMIDLFVDRSILPVVYKYEVYLQYHKRSLQFMMAKNGSEITCAMCGKAIIDKDQERRIVEVIDSTVYNFDSNDCVLMFKKFRNVYGISFIEV